MANVGVTFDFAAESAKLRTEIDKVRKELGTLNATAKGIGQGFKALGGMVAGAFSGGAIGAFIGRVNNAIDALNDLSGRLGASAAGLQALHLAAGLAGGSAEGVNVALSKMSTVIGDALAGNKQAADSFARIGLSAQQLAELKPDEAFRLINQRLSEIPNTFERASAAQDIYGKGAKDIAGLIAEGDAAIQSVNEQLAKQGALLSDLDVAKIGVMNDELQFQQTVVTNLGAKFLSGLAPSVGVATGAVAEMLGRMGGATEAGKLFGTVMVGAFKVVETAAYGLAATFETVRAVISGMLAIIADGIGSVLGGVASTAEFFGLQIAGPIRNAENLMNDIGTSLQNVSDRARENAVQAASYAIEAAGNAAGAIVDMFNAAQANYEAKAAAAAARNAAAQGLGTSVVGAGVDPNSARMSDGANIGTGLKDDGKLDSLAKDPTTDPKYLYEQSLNAAMLQLQSDDAATRLNLAQATNASFLDSLLLTGDMMIAAEEVKNQTLGQSMASLADMAIQQGGAMGKFGKAFAIAQTIWSTGSAIMKAYQQLGPIAGTGAAAMIAAQGAMQLANIKKTNIGSSGSIAGASGGGSASSSALADNVPATKSSESEQKSAVQIVVQGNVFSSQETVDWLAEKLGEAINNRDLVFINGNSRQAAELVGA